MCEIGIERRHYSPELIKLDPSLSREEIDKTVDELAPSAVRGQKSESPLKRDARLSVLIRTTFWTLQKRCESGYQGQVLPS